MSNLPKQSAYKSSITFTDDGVTTKPTEKREANNYYEGANNYMDTQASGPFKVARDYDVDIEITDADDP